MTYNVFGGMLNFAQSNPGVLLFSHCLYVHPSMCLWSFTESLLTQYLINHLWKFQQRSVYFSSVRDKGEPIRFRGKKVEVQGHSKTTYCQISRFRGIFSTVSGMRGCTLYFNETSQLLIVTSTWRWWHFQSCVQNSS